MPRQRPAEEGLLFDLPLDRPAAESAPPRETEEWSDGEQPALPLLETDTGVEDEEQHLAEDETTGARPRDPEPRRRARQGREATLALRLAAGLTDLGACLAVALALYVLLLAQGLRPGVDDWPAGAVFLLTFSFLYAVLPLAFWGRTPGMTLAGLRATSADGRPLAFRQAVLVWLGGVLTVALAGLPLLLALGGRSLGDRISGARTRVGGRPAL